jgi:hypothetical protein
MRKFIATLLLVAVSSAQAATVSIKDFLHDYPLVVNADGSINATVGLNGIVSLDGLTAPVQVFATGTSGVDFNISSGTTGSITHTFNLPDASSTARGVVSTGAQSFAGTKTFSNLIQGSISGNAATVTTVPNVTGPIAVSANVSTITNQTGSGTTFVMQGSPTLTTPNLGTPSALVGTNITGTAAGLTAGSVTTIPNLSGPITSAGNVTSVASQTGTGSVFVMQASPTLTTPNIGTATGSASLNALKSANLSDMASASTAWANIVQNPSASTLGGVQSIVSTASNWIDSISTSGVPHKSQPAFSDLSGSIGAGQMLNPQNGYYMVENWTSANASGLGSNNWTVANSGTGSATSSPINTSSILAGNRIGVMSLTPGTAAAPNYSTTHLYQGKVAGGGVLTWSAGLQLSALSSAATFDYAVYAGFLNFFTGTESSTDMMVYYKRALTFTCSSTSTNSSSSITNLSGCSGVVDPSSIQVGMAVTDSKSCFQANTTVSVAPGGGTTLTLNQNTNGSGCGSSDTLTFTVGNYWICDVADNSTHSKYVTSQAVAAGTWYDVGMVINAAGTSATCYINGTAAATMTSNIPTTTTRAMGEGLNMIMNAYTSGSAPLLYHDYFYVNEPFTSPI